MVNENLSFTNYASGIWLPDSSKLVINPKKDHDVTICWHEVIVIFFDVVLFLLSILVTALSFMSISMQRLELWQFTFIRHWPEIQKSEMPSSEFFHIHGEWGELGITNLARMSPITCYWMLQNARVISFAVSKLLRENQQGRKRLKLPHPHPILQHPPSFFLRPRLPLSNKEKQITFAWP